MFQIMIILCKGMKSSLYVVEGKSYHVNLLK